MTILLLGVSFIFGAVIASFIGVVVARLNTGESIINGRSHCDACGRTLDIFDLVPILSYVAMQGCTRCCGARLSWQSPVSEIVLGVGYALAYNQLGLSLPLVVLFIVLALLLALVLYDLAHLILPTKLIVPFVLASVLFAWLVAPDTNAFLLIVVVGCIPALVLGGLFLISHGRWMGLADAPLSFGLALIAGPSALTGFVYSFWIGAVIGIVMLSMRPAGSRMGIEVPFAPFLALGFLTAYFTAWNPFLAISLLMARL